MSQQQRMIVIGLVVLLLAVYGRRLIGRPSVSAPAASSASVPAPAETHPPLLSGTALRHDAQHAALEGLDWGRSPFGEVAQEREQILLTLNGIFWDAQNPTAIINGQTLHVGESFAGYAVTQITTEHVIVTNGKETIQLDLAPQE